MAPLERFKKFISRNIIAVVMIPSLVGLHMFWAHLQEDDRFVAEHERREFPPITLYRHAKYFLGLGPQPEKHPPPGGSSK